MTGADEAPPAGRLSLSVIVPATNEPTTLARCLAAVRAADEPPEQTIVVTTPVHSGPAAARNDGASRAEGDVLVFVDSDVEVHGDCFARIRRRFERDSSLVALFGSYDDEPGAGGWVSDFRNLLHHHVHQVEPGAATTFWAGLGAVRVEPFREAGGFDVERFPVPAVEDIDLGMRLAAAGHRIELDPDLQGKHLKRWSLLEMLRTDLLHRGAPWVALLLERRTTSTALNLGWRHRASAAAAVGLAAAAAGRRPRVAGACLAVYLAANLDLYRLLYRKRALRGVLVGLPLHLLHQWVAAVAVPLGVRLYLRRRKRRARPAAPE